MFRCGDKDRRRNGERMANLEDGSSNLQRQKHREKRCNEGSWRARI